MRLAVLALAISSVGFYALPAQACGAKKAGHAGGCGAAKAGGCGGGCAAGCGSDLIEAAIDRGTYNVPTKVAWRTLDEGWREAKAKNLPMLVHFTFGTQCQECENRAKQTFGDKKLAGVLNPGHQAIPIRVPLWAMTPKERALGEKINYQEECVLALIDLGGNVMKASSGIELKTRGVPDPEALISTLQPLVN